MLHYLITVWYTIYFQDGKKESDYLEHGVCTDTVVRAEAVARENMGKMIESWCDNYASRPITTYTIQRVRVERDLRK